ncbi:hypothetical protein BEP19_02400 [Ammoniphilus oxalaticus]|uniref:Uncharacterized protein n=1 Tax=Ammoniphilus oxalaticus TaxID=66863 RepID=A0A419SND6_9BACL|nr:hypothetical protein BEP19_02400 [Ammoniphilus oxalaticus]
MSISKVDKLLKAIGKACFIRYYYEFKKLAEGNGSNMDVVNRMKEDYTFKSKQTRTSKGKKI